MNCECGIPAVSMLYQGKPCFKCSLGSCNWFRWAQKEYIPRSLPFQSQKPQVPQAKINNLVKNEIHSTLPGGTCAELVGKVPFRGPSVTLCFGIRAIEQNSSGTKVWIDVTFPFHEALNSLMRSLPEACAQYDAQRKLWTISFEIYERLVSVLNSSQYAQCVTVEELPRFLVKGLHSYIENQRGIPEAFQKNEELQLNLTEPFYDMVLPYQLDGIRFIVRHGGRGLIADEMGCGKTCQAIGVMMHYRQLWPALIIVPSELLASQWSSEIQKFMGDLIHSDEIHIVKSGKLAVNKGKLCLISYSMLDRTLAKNSRYFQNFHVVVADEAHSLKNPNSKQSLNAVPLLKKAKVAVCITGTPQPNRPVELYPMCNALLPNVFSSYDGFTARYCNARPATFGYRGAGPTMDVRGASNEVELRTLLESLVMIRRLKDQVLDDLPVKERMQIFVEPDADRKEELSVARAEYDKLNRKASERGFNGSEAQRANAKQQRDIAANYLWALTGKSKIAGIKTEILRLLKDASVKRRQEEDLHNNKILTSTESTIPAMADNFAGDPVRYRDTNDVTRDGIFTSGKQQKSTLIMQLEDDEVVFTGTSRPTKKSAPVIYESSNELCDTSDDEPEVKVVTSKRSSSSYQRVVRDLEDVSTKKAWSSDSSDDECVSRKRKISNKKDQNNKAAKRGSVEQMSGDGDDSDLEWGDVFDRRESPLRKSFAPAPGNGRKKSTKSKPLKAKESPKKAKYKGFGQKIIVFAHHQDVMNSIDDLLCDEDVKFVRIDGTTTMSRRTQLVTQFQEDDDTELALLSIKVCGTGMNLSRANVAIFAELDWAPGQIFQAEDRIHRLGQRSKTVKLLYILTKGGSDEFMWDILQRKVAIMESTIGVAADQRADNGKFGASERGNDADGKALIMQRSMDAFVTRSVKSDLQSSSRSPDRGIAGKEVQLLKASEPNWVYNTFQSVNNLSRDKMQPKPVVESGSTPRSLSPSTLSRIEANKLAARKRREQKLQSEKQPLTAVSGSSTIQGLGRAFLGAPKVATLPQAAHNAPVCPTTLRDVALRQEGRATSRSAD